MPGFHESEITRALKLQLRTEEAACLIAECLSYEFTAVNRDPLRPIAWAYERGEGSYRIDYRRPAAGVFLPSSNGHFTRSRRDTDPGHGPFRTNPLGRIRFEPGSVTGTPHGAAEWIIVDIDPIGAATCTIRATVTMDTSGWAEQRLDKLLAVVDLAACLKRAAHLARVGDFDPALELLEASTLRHRTGFSSLHDPLLARAYAMRARLLSMAGRVVEARRFANLASLLTPTIEFSLLESRIRQRLAHPEAALESLVRATDRAIPGEARAKALAFAADRARKRTQAAQTVGGCLAQSRKAIRERDWSGAAAWANRALDLDPGAAEALRTLAESYAGMSRHEDARDLRLMALHGEAATHDLIQAIAGDEQSCGDDALALRWMLRHGEKLPELLSHPSTQRLARELGWQRTLRMLRTEHMHDAALPLALGTMRDSKSARDLFVARLLARDALLAEPDRDGRPSRGIRSPEMHTGTSGVRFSRPASPPR